MNQIICLLFKAENLIVSSVAYDKKAQAFTDLTSHFAFIAAGGLSLYKSSTLYSIQSFLLECMFFSNPNVLLNVIMSLAFVVYIIWSIIAHLLCVQAEQSK